MYRNSESDETWHHPLIRKADSRVTRRRLILGATGAVALVTFPGQLGQVAAQDATPSPVATPTFSPTGDADATALLISAAEAMAALSTFHFDLETVSGDSSVMGLDVQKVTGDVKRPLDFQAEATVKVPFGSLTVKAVGLDGQFYIQNPLASDQKWTALDGGSDLIAVVNPDVIILFAVRLLQDAKIDGSEKYAGVETTRVTGEVDFQKVAETVLGTSGSSGGVTSQIAQGPVPLIIWISHDNLIQAIEIDGPLLAQEGADVTRLVSFDSFNDPVDIEMPPL
ncbi:MAG TPA: LppX_LprAFG lipoprotein [Thermomicrobiales bacterium]|nr:LppX_LprAFG lipoprotein [Thermomicrobiales bacterium]